MSHVKNVEAFDKVLGICTGYGGKYNPGQQNLQVNAMTTMLTHARQVLHDVASAKTAYDNATNQREVIFGDIRSLSTRIIGSLKSSGAMSQTVNDAKVMVRKIAGVKLPDRDPIPAGQAVDPKVKTRTANGLDYGSLASHFEKLLETLSAESLYQPNEQELQVKGLMSKLASMRKGNTEVNLAEVELGNARTKRNAMLYAGTTGLYDTAKAIKQYVKSVFGTRSEEYQKVRRIRFIKPKM